MSARNGAKAAMIGGFLLVGLVAVALLILARASRADALETGADAPSPRGAGLTLPVSIPAIAPNPLDGARTLPFGVPAIAPAAEKTPRTAGNPAARETPRNASNDASHDASRDGAPSSDVTEPAPAAPKQSTTPLAGVLAPVTQTVAPVLDTIGRVAGRTLGDALPTTARRVAPILGMARAGPAAMGTNSARPTAIGAPGAPRESAPMPVELRSLSFGAGGHTMIDQGATPPVGAPASPALPPVDAPATGNGGGSRSSGGHWWTPVVFLAFVGLVLGVGRRFAFDVRLLRSQRLALLLERPG